jgi:hypothetical protein
MRSALLPRRLCPDDELTGSYSESEGPLGHSALISLVCSRRVAYSEISNNVGPVKSFFCFFSAFLSLFFFFEHTTAFTPKSGLPGPFFDRCFDDLGSLIIFRSTSVRPKHLFDPYFEP